MVIGKKLGLKQRRKNEGRGWGVFLIPLLVFLLSFSAWADYFSPSDSVPLTIGTLSVNSDSV